MSGRLSPTAIAAMLCDSNTQPNTSSNLSVMHFQPSTYLVSSHVFTLTIVECYKPQDSVNLQLGQ